MNKRECEIQLRLFKWLCYERKHKWIVPNVRQIFSTGECDVFSMTAKGTGYEWEIKTSRSDFKNDAKKGLSDFNTELSKYELMRRRRAGETTFDRPWGIGKFSSVKAGITLITPHRFSYVTPAGLLKIDELPEFAGLYELEPGHKGSFEIAWIREVRKPQAIHCDDLPANLMAKLGEKLMFRFWKERDRTLTLDRAIADLKSR